MKRFQDDNIRIYHFEREIFVKCPKCELRAIVSDDDSTIRNTRRIKCPNCYHNQIGRKQSFQVELSCKCSHCSGDINLKIPNVNEKKEFILIKCPQCGKTENYQPRNIRLEWINEYKGFPTEPYYQLPLWLTTNVKGNTLWAYNYEHLAYLKRYISADLREKNGRAHWTLVEKLPEWMSSKKNRESVIKAIEKLEIK